MDEEYNTSYSETVFSNMCQVIPLDVSGAESLMYTDFQLAMLRYVMPTVFVIGVFNNLAFIYVVIHSQNMQTTTNKCLFHLSVADLLFLIVATGERFWRFTYSPIDPDDTAYGPFGCSLFKLLRSTSYFSSLAFITIVSVERFYAVCRYQKKRSPDTYRNIIAGCWFLSFLLSITFIPSVSAADCFHLIWPEEAPYNEFTTNKWTVCLPYNDQVWLSIYTDAVQTIPFVVLLITNLCLYYFIISGLNQAIKRAHLTGKRLRNTEIRNQIAWMLVANGIIFFTLLSPKEISFLVKSFLPDDPLLSPAWKNINEITHVLAYINAGINPIVYSLLSSKHRKAFQDAFVPRQCVPGAMKPHVNGANYLQAIDKSQQEETSMGYRHSPRLGLKLEKTETETV